MTPPNPFTDRGKGAMDLRDPATQALLEEMKQEALKRIRDEHRGQASLHLDEGEVLAW